jgi:hypothetical protein
VIGRPQIVRLARTLSRADELTSPLDQAWAHRIAHEDMAALADLGPEAFRDALASAESLGEFYEWERSRRGRRA